VTASGRPTGPPALRTVRALTAIAPLQAAELDAAVALLRRGGFGAAVADLIAYPRDSPHGEMLAARDSRGAVVGMACCASFGHSGWIGALAVAPESRRHGLGTALTEAAVDWLRSRGAVTVSLYATPAGRAVYERMGFVAEGSSTAWSGTAGARCDVQVRRLTESDRDAMATLDRGATSENRYPVLGALRPLNGLCATVNGRMSGFCVASPWGSGVAILADDPASGVALMAASASDPGPGTLIVPDQNHAATDALRHWGFQRYNSAERMRLGPALGWRPERQFGQFNLFWG
jgi:GNAT superfamily N-acetyltransferase